MLNGEGTIKNIHEWLALSPRERARLPKGWINGGPQHPPLRPAPIPCPFRLGERVVLKNDPKPVGTVTRAFIRAVGVRWDATGWVEEIEFDKLQRADLIRKQYLVRKKRG